MGSADIQLGRPPNERNISPVIGRRSAGILPCLSATVTAYFVYGEVNILFEVRRGRRRLLFARSSSVYCVRNVLSCRGQ